MRLALPLVAALALAGCAGPRPAGAPPAVEADVLPGVIRPVRLVAGRTDTLAVADLVGADLAARPGALAFGPSAGAVLAVTYDAPRGTLALRPADGFTGLALLPFSVGTDSGYALAVEVTAPTTHTFTFTPDLATPGAPAPEVHVIGAFNDWSRGRDRLADADGDGTLSLTLPVPPGRYEYKFTVGEREAVDATNPDSVLNPFGAYNSLLTVQAPGRGAVLRLLDEVALDMTLLSFVVEVAGETERPALRAEDVVVLFDNEPLSGWRLNGDTIRVVVPGSDPRMAAGARGAEPRMSRLRLAADVDGSVTPWVEVPLYGGRPLAAVPDAPFTWNDAIIYQLVLDRFRDGDPANSVPLAHDSLSTEANYQGGDLAGVLEKLDYLDSLGVNVLWLSPVYDNPATAERESPPPHRVYSGYHGYWPAQPRAVDEHLGDLPLLRRVVDEAHARGIRVLLDFVAAHVHESHPYARAHPEWFGRLELPDGTLNLRRWDEYRLTTWFEPYLPKFDYDAAPAAVDQLTADAVWWLEQTGADGFRHDAVKHIPNGFWRALTARLRREVSREAPLFQIGETFGSPALVAGYVSPGQLDAQFNFNLYDAAVAAFASESGSFETLAAEVERSLAVYGPLHRMGNVMSSHDKPRFLALVENDLAVEDPVWGENRPRVDDPASYRTAALYLAYLMTTPGVPVVYYGDEIGLTGANDPDNRRMMRWDDVTADERALREEARRLIALRNEHPALRLGTYETLLAGADTWAFLRATPDGAVLVVLNKGDAPAMVALDLPAAYTFRTAADALGAGSVHLHGGRFTVTIPPGGYRVVDLGR
jgi:cyclomaltodextrinase